MSDISAAEENLRVIRSLMERAVIYRAISAPTALVAGVLSVVAAVAFYFVSMRQADLATGRFALVWIWVLLVTLAANTAFMWRSSQQRREPFVSPGMKLALHSVTPAFLSGAVATMLFVWANGSLVMLAAVWMLSYGLGLLATTNFAPRSLTLLGWAFLTAGLVLLILLVMEVVRTMNPLLTASLAMGCTFGLFHLLYAILTRVPSVDRTTNA